MTRDFKEALRHRRTYYHITNSSPISDEQIKEIIDSAVMNVPSCQLPPGRQLANAFQQRTRHCKHVCPRQRHHSP